MDLHKKNVGDVTIISVSGNIKGCPEAEVIHVAIKESLNKNTTKLVIDMSDVHWVGSVGIGAIIGGLTTVRHNGGDLRLVGINAKIKNLLSITKLEGLFQVFDDVGSAVSSYQSFEASTV